MTRKLGVYILAFAFAVCGFAGPSKASEDDLLLALEGLDEEERDSLKTALAELAGPSEADTESGELGTVALEVADKALDLSVSGVAGEIEKVAPKVWGIAILHQYAKVARMLFLPVGLLLGTLLFQIPFRRNYMDKLNKMDPDNWPVNGFLKDASAPCYIFARYIIPYCCFAIFGLWTLVAMKNSTLILINPKYYAIQDIIFLFSGQMF